MGGKPRFWLAVTERSIPARGERRARGRGNESRVAEPAEGRDCKRNDASGKTRRRRPVGVLRTSALEGALVGPVQEVWGGCQDLEFLSRLKGEGIKGTESGPECGGLAR